MFWKKKDKKHKVKLVKRYINKENKELEKAIYNLNKFLNKKDIYHYTTAMFVVIDNIYHEYKEEEDKIYIADMIRNCSINLNERTRVKVDYIG